ncbi:MAG TPA: hypothetical protein VFJ97_10460 [Dermatophilaceae bacterium]|nr:hypothetical protein [Dermatophilaceae bacterium]
MLTRPGRTARNPVLSDPDDARRAAHALARGAVVAHGFANFYVITTRADAATVRQVNLMKGRPAHQVGSITAPPEGIPELWDLDQLPAGLTPHLVREVVDTFFERGPFGFRGPAARHLPEHLTAPDHGVLTAQVIAPGYACPSNGFLAESVRATGDPYLYITSANRSRHLTGADDSPAHWRAEGLRAEFGDVPGFLLLQHGYEPAARASYPAYLPMSTTILGFHVEARDEHGRSALLLERHGSLHAEEVRRVLDRMGLGLTVRPSAQRRLLVRDYAKGLSDR